MSVATLQFGSPIAPGRRLSSAIEGLHGQPPATLGELLDILTDKPPKTFPTLKTVTVLLGTLLNRPAREIALDEVERSRDNFHEFLVARRYAQNSIKTYLNHLRIILQLARQHGWQSGRSVPESWAEVYGLSKKRKCGKLVRYLTQIRSSPREVTIADVEEWVVERAKRGASYFVQKTVASRFWRLLRECACTEIDLKTVIRQERYGIAIAEFEPSLKAEVESLLKWKQSAFAVDRPKGAKVRAVTAKTLARIISMVVGFAVNILHMPAITRLEHIITREVIGGFVEWNLNERSIKGGPLMGKLSHLHSAMRQHPAYASLDLNWFKRLLDNIPVESDSERKRRKAEKYLEYDALSLIPGKLRAARSAAERRGVRALAMLVMSELLIRWLLLLPMRQRNLRECRIGGSRPNLFKGKIPPFSEIEIPNWVLKSEQSNPRGEFWMIRFAADETKTGNEPQLLLPKRLIEPLQEYIEAFRPTLIRGKDPGTLFLNSSGKPLDASELTRIVSQVTLRFGGRRVTPHLFRDIFAYGWLREHPKDFLTVSKSLWHRNINTTIQIYGGRFNESTAAVAIESWLDEKDFSSAESKPPA